MTQVAQQPVQAPAQVPAPTNGQVTLLEKNIADSTLARVQQMQENNELQLPKDYSAANALKSAWLILADKPDLLQCDKTSIAYALLNMVTQGLNPAKRQCSFIKYGNKLVMQREYQGSIALAKRHGLKSVIANAIFKGDEFGFEVDGDTGRKKIVLHVPSFDSMGSDVIGAYAIVTMDDGSKNVEVMNMKQIQAAWQMGATKGQSPAHKNFPDQMACKTVIGRALKMIINSSDDSALFEDDPIIEEETPITAAVKQEIKDNANGAGGNSESIGFEDLPKAAPVVTPAPESTPESTPEAIQGTQIKAPF